MAAQKLFGKPDKVLRGRVFFSVGLIYVIFLSLFREHCIPILMTLWSIRDGHVRMILLKYFGLYGTSFKEEVLENFILPQVR